MDRQALRDAVIRYNAEGVDGLFDRPKGHRRERLSESKQAVLANAAYKGPQPEVDGVCTRAGEALAAWIFRRFAKTVHPDSVTRLLRRMGLPRQKARPFHPKGVRQVPERFQRKGSAAG